MTFDWDAARDAEFRREERRLLTQFDAPDAALLRDFCTHVLETADDPAVTFADVLSSPMLKAAAIAEYCSLRAEATVLGLPDLYFNDPFGDACDRAYAALKEAA